VLVCTDRGSLSPKPIPDALRRALEPFVFSEVEARTAVGLAEPTT